MLEFCKNLPDGWSVVCSAERWLIIDEDGSVVIDADDPSEMIGCYTMYCSMREEWYSRVQTRKDMAILAAELLYSNQVAEA